jgi:hypothetical protein
LLAPTTASSLAASITFPEVNINKRFKMQSSFYRYWQTRFVISWLWRNIGSIT